MIYKPQYFQFHEMVTKTFYLGHEINDQLWWMIDDRVIWTMDRFRETYGKCFVNNWFWGGNNEYGGWRPFDCNVGAYLSQHKFGRAADLKFEKYTAAQIRGDIINEFKHNAWWRGPFKYITCLESGVPWLHFDVRNWQTHDNGGELLIVKGA